MQTQSNQQPNKQAEKKSDSIVKVLTTNAIKTAWSHPVGKFVFIAGGGLLLTFATGWLFRLLAWVRVGYNQFKNSGSKGLRPAQAKS
jgi:hypothetical protein